MSTYHRNLTGLNTHEPFHFVQESDPGAVGANLYWLQVSTGIVKRRNALNSAWGVVGGSNIENFIDLLDCPSSYAGQAGKVATVNGTEDGIEFIAPGAATLPDWLALSPDAAPTSPNAMDDEFNDADTLPGGATPLWAWRNQGTSTATINKSHLNLTCAGNPAVYFSSTLEQNCPSNPWEFTAKIGAEFIANPSLAVFGIIVLETSTGKYINYAVQNINGDTIRFTRYQMVNATTYNSQTDITTGFRNLPLYLRIADNGTNFIFSVSNTGSKFETINTVSRTGFLTGSADKIGLGITYDDGRAFSLNCDWFRRTV